MRYGLIFAMLLVVAPAARAQCYGCALEMTQVRNRNLLSDNRDLLNQIYDDMMRNSAAVKTGLPMQEIRARIGKFERALQYGQSIAGVMRDADQRFRVAFPGYSQIVGPYADNYRRWSQTALDTMSAMLKAASDQRAAMADETDRILGDRSTGMGAQGRMQATQALVLLTAQIPEQIQKLRDLMIADMSSKAIYQASQLQREAAGAAAAEHYFRFVPQADSGNRGYSLR